MGWKDVVYFILLVLEYIVCNWIVLEGISKKLKTRRKRYFLFGGLLVLACLYAYNGISCIISTGIVSVLPILMLILLVIILKKDILVVCIWNYLLLGYMSLIKLFQLVLIGLYKKQNIIEVNYRKADLGIVIVEFLIVLCLWFIYKRTRMCSSIIQKLLMKNKFLFLIIGIFESEIMSFVMENCMYEMESPMLFWVCGTVIGVVVILSFLVIKMMYAQIQMENHMMIQKQKNMEMYYSQMRKNYENIARINHNIKHERLYIYQCLKNNQIDDAIKHLEDIVQKVSVRKVWTGNKTIDFLIDIKWQEMKEKNIVCKLHSDFFSLPIPENEFCLVLGLLLENAVEASEKCEQNKKWVEIALVNRNDIFQLILKNSCCSMPQERNGKLISSKKEDGTHGWGLLNVENIVEKYEGKINYNWTSEEFSLSIIFWNIYERRE